MIFDSLTYEQCVAQGVGPTVFPQRLEKGTDPAHSAQMKAVCVHNMQQQVKLQYVLTKAWTALTRAGIRPVLMKGAGLAALYPSPEQRAWGDIDLLVGIDQYHPACAVMRETFPDSTGFSYSIVKYMKQWYSFYNERVIKSHQPGGQIEEDEKSQRPIGFLEMPEFFSHIPWGQHIDIIDFERDVQNSTTTIWKIHALWEHKINSFTASSGS